MNHDIAHCEGKGCFLKDKCKRYIAHLEAVEENMKCICYIIPQSSGEDCQSYYKL